MRNQGVLCQFTLELGSHWTCLDELIDIPGVYATSPFDALTERWGRVSTVRTIH